MSVVFPANLDDTSTFPIAATLTAETLADEPHSLLHETLGTAILALETKVGINSSADTDSLDYKINHISGVSVPAGGLIPFAGSSAPAGFLLCYGQLVSTTTYPDLFTAIGTTYGSGTGTFGIPDLRGRVIAGLDNIGGVAASRIAAATALGGSGGEEKHTLITAELASHNHVITVSVSGISGTVSGTTAAGGAHTHPVDYDVATYTVGGGLGPFIRVFESGLSNGATQDTEAANPSTHTHTFTGSFSGTASGTGSSGSTGSGTAHNNLQPYIGLNWLIAV